MSEKKYRAYICCGPNCGPKDSRALLDYLSDEITRLGLDERVSALPTGCQAHCLSGPTMVIYPGPTYYQGITSERLDRIIQQHFVGNEPVEEYFWRGQRLRILPKRSLDEVKVEAPRVEKPVEPAPIKKRERKAPEVDDFKW